jgi:hypothetical protein
LSKQTKGKATGRRAEPPAVFESSKNTDEDERKKAEIEKYLFALKTTLMLMP